MWQWLAKEWTEATPQVQAAVISGVFTAVTATIGVFVVVLQLRGQAKNARRSNEHIERLKLKKETYETIAHKCSEVLATTKTPVWALVGSPFSGVTSAFRSNESRDPRIKCSGG
jgi:hypothetical protein